MEHMKVTKEVADIVANWWADRVCKNVKFDNGDDSETGLIGMGLAMMCVQDVTDEQRQKFVESLSGKIEGQDYLMLSVDYHPGLFLREAAKEAGISENNFPWKTSTISIFDPNENCHKIYARHGYRAEPEVISVLR